MDKFKVEVLRAMPNPQQAIWVAMHQDYSEDFVIEQIDKFPSEKESGDLVVKHLLNGGRGHYGPLEHPQIVFNVGYFPHSFMQQIRTHRVGISFDCQSFRYTGQRILDVANHARTVEDVFYIRPVGDYNDRQGKKYHYSQEQRIEDIEWCDLAAHRYAERIDQGLAEEHARSILPFDVRQHFVMSCNVRSLMHLLDLRWKKDAQLEAQQFCDLVFPHFEKWTPAIAAWYLSNRARKARLSP